jgi:hypothetical protein
MNIRPEICLCAICVLLIVAAVWLAGQSEAGLLAECEQYRPHYECVALLRAP